MGSLGELDPREARDAATLVELMRRLKDQSRLTYRQLEERAAERGEALARSTLADVMRRDTLPRPEVLAAFVRACSGSHEVEAWLKARDRIVSGDDPQSDTATPVRVASPLRRAHLTSVAVVVALLTACAWLWAAEDANERPEGTVAAVGPSGSGRQSLLLSEQCPRVMVQGQHDPCVQELQRQLHRHGLDLPTDAVFGPYTKMRVAAFQTFAGLSVTAMGDEATNPSGSGATSTAVGSGACSSSRTWN
ncbi:peptidoglycan-binding protein [Streptomyces ipomoeae]|nr:peptidoglycan-binding protein [Streptomyces ipomoeae]